MNDQPRGLARLDVSAVTAFCKILADVINDGDPKCANVPWELYQSDCIDYDKANAQRLDFIAEVKRRIWQRATAQGEQK